VLVSYSARYGCTRSGHHLIRIVDAEEVANVIAYLVFDFASHPRGLS
jgi:hypothetical protein